MDCRLGGGCVEPEFRFLGMHCIQGPKKPKCGYFKWVEDTKNLGFRLIKNRGSYGVYREVG